MLEKNFNEFFGKHQEQVGLPLDLSQDKKKRRLQKYQYMRKYILIYIGITASREYWRIIGKKVENFFGFSYTFFISLN